MQEFKSIFNQGSDNQNNNRGGEGRRRRNNNRNNTPQNFNSEAVEEYQNIDAMRRKLEQEEQRIAASCTHTNKKGNSTLEPIANSEFIRCSLCKAEFRHTPIKRDELVLAVSTVFSAIQQIRSYGGNSPKERAYTQSLGELGYSVNRVPELYNNLTQSISRNKNRGPRRRNNNSQVAAYRDALSIVGIDN